MTVAELRAALAALPDDADVYTYGDDAELLPVDKVELLYTTNQPMNSFEHPHSRRVAGDYEIVLLT